MLSFAAFPEGSDVAVVNKSATPVVEAEARTDALLAGVKGVVTEVTVPVYDVVPIEIGEIAVPEYCTIRFPPETKALFPP